MTNSSSRIRLLCCFALASASIVTASVSSVDTSTLKSLGLSRKEIKEARSQEDLENIEDEEVVEQEVDEEEESYKLNDDWWKDPLAMFSDDEDEVMPDDEEVIDESVPIINEAESLGEDIAVDTVVVEQEQAEQEEEEEEEEELEEELVIPDEEAPPPPAPAKKVSPKVVDTPESDATTETAQTSKAPPSSKVKVKVASKKPDSSKDKQVAAKSDSSSSSSSFASPLALLVPLFPKLQGALTSVSGSLSQAPVLSLAASAAIAKVCIDSIKRKKSDKKVIEHLDKHSAIGDDESLDSEESIEEIISADQEEDEEEEEEQMDVSRKTTFPLREVMSRRPRLPWVQGVRDKFARTSGGNRLPSARELYAQVETLKQQLSKAEFERDSMEKEYEKASFKVQEQHTELTTMGTTTKYLKAQLRDNEDAMNKAIRAERRKAKEEVSRMKEAMVGMLNKERKAMRDELKRQTLELRSLLTEATGGDVMVEER